MPSSRLHLLAAPNTEEEQCLPFRSLGRSHRRLEPSGRFSWEAREYPRKWARPQRWGVPARPTRQGLSWDARVH